MRLEWFRLWERCAWATPFQSPQWLLPWFHHLFRGGRLLALALRNGNGLAGLVPLFIWGDNGQPRRISLLGAGITDYLDVLLEPDVGILGMEMILDHLEKHRVRWDLCDFQELRIGSPLLRARTPATLRSRRLESGTCPVLELPRSFEDLRARLPSKFRTDLRRSCKRLAVLRSVRFETGSKDNLSEYLEALFQLHSARWKQRSQPGVLATGRLREFHREVAAEFMACGWLRLHALRYNGTIIAVIYGFAAKGRAYAYLGGFEPALSRLSPGTVLMRFAIEQAIEEELLEFDFLRKKEEYKYLWGARDRINQRLLLLHQSTAASSFA